MSSNIVIDVSSCGDARPVCRERARLQSANGHMTDVVGPSNIRLRFARSKPQECFRTLVGRQGRRTAKTHPAGLCALPALTCTRADQLTLELSNAAQHGDRQAAVRRGGVGPTIGQRFAGSGAFAILEKTQVSANRILHCRICDS
jgi:hypothetical protein